MKSKQKRTGQVKASEILTEAQEFKIKRLKSKRKEKHRPKKAVFSIIRQRPTLPPDLSGSTIGAVRLNFRVRNGNGCTPHAMATETMSAPPTGAASVR